MRATVTTGGAFASLVFIQLGAFLVYVALGCITFSYSLWVIFGKDAPWYADLVGGILLGETTIPLGVILWILSLAGVITHPLFQ